MIRQGAVQPVGTVTTNLVCRRSLDLFPPPHGTLWHPLQRRTLVQQPTPFPKPLILNIFVSNQRGSCLADRVKAHDPIACVASPGAVRPASKSSAYDTSSRSSPSRTVASTASRFHAASGLENRYRSCQS